MAMSDLSVTISQKWSALLGEAQAEADFLRPVVEAAAVHPQLRKLFPFRSASRLCFASNAEYPFEGRYLIDWRGGDVYAAEVTNAPGHWMDTRELRAGTATEVVAHIATLLSDETH